MYLEDAEEHGPGVDIDVAGGLVVVVLTHVCEALDLFPWMHWGLKHSVGHYLDFWSAVLGLTLSSVGYLFHALKFVELSPQST